MDNLITFYQQRFNLQNAIFSRIEHEDALIAIVYKVTLPDHTQYILKICPSQSDYRCEVYFLRYFTDRLPVPRIIQVAEPEPGINGAILMEYLPGTLLKITDFNDALAYEIGSSLARIHSNRVEGYGDLTQPQNLSPDPSSYFTLKFEEELTECKDHLPKTLLDLCHNYYNKHANLLASVDGPCITHRDFRPGNVIICDGKLQGIIDWARARGSFSEEDFCPMEFGKWPSNTASKKSFLEGYASIRKVPNYDNLMPLLSMSRAIATIGFTVKSGTWENKNSVLYQRKLQFLEEFFRRQL